MKTSLLTMTKFINVIISLKDKSDKYIHTILEKLEQFCLSSCEIYAFILHDKDVLDSGELKHKHIHLVGTLRSSKIRLSTTLNNISEICGLNTDAISIEKLADINGGIQYLIHKNQPSKYQYDVSFIKSNLSSSELQCYLDSGQGFSLSTIEESIIKNKGNRRLIMRDIGLVYYHNYRREIIDLIDSYMLGEFGAPF